MRARSLVLLCAVLAWACAGAEPDPDAAVRRLLPDHRSDAPGAAVIAIRNGVVVERAAWGMADLERGVPIGTDTAFRLASVSKQFTAMAILMLAENGRARGTLSRCSPSGGSRSSRPASATSTAIQATSCWP